MPPSRTPADAEGLVALAALGERRGDDRQSGRRDDRGTQTLQGARGDQLGVVRRQAAEQRGQREQAQAEDEDPAAAEQVGGAPAQQQEAAEHQRVRVHHPLEVLLREVQLGLNRRQRDVHDRRVEHDHELRGAQQDQRDPPLGVWG
jgi:hypothetical protein